MEHYFSLVFPLLSAALLVAIAWMVGQVVTGLILGSSLEPEERHFFALGLGLGVISHIILAVGLLNKLALLSAGLILGFVAIGGGLLYYRSRYSLLGTTGSILEGIRPDRLTKVLLLFLVTLGFLNLISALAPPSDADSLRHHLAAPRVYAQLGGFPFIPVFWWNAPGLQQVLHTLILLLFNDITVQVLNWVHGILLTLAVYWVGKRYFSHAAGLLGAAIFYSLPLTSTLSGGSYVEFLVAFYALLSVLALLKAGDKLSYRWILLAGLMGGLAGATKLWGLLTLPASTAVLLALYLRRPCSTWQRLFAAVALYSMIFAVVLSPWLIRNYIASGDPLWPYTSSIFQNEYWQSWQTEKFGNWERGPGQNLWYYLIGPWSLTNNIAAYSPDTGPLSPSLLPPLMLAFLPGLWLFRERLSEESKKATTGFAVYALTVYSVWFLGYQQPRYIQVVHPFICILTGAAIWLYWAQLKERKGLQTLVAVMVVGALLGMLLVNVARNVRAIPFVLGLESKGEYLSRSVSFYEDLQWANVHLPSGSKVLFVGLQSLYYLDRPFILGAPAYQGMIQYGKYETPNELLGKLQDLGVTHVYFEGLGYGNAEDLQDAWEKRPELYNDEIVYQEWLPVSLLRPLVEEGRLKLLYNARSSVVRSRVFGRREAAYISIYEIE